MNRISFTTLFFILLVFCGLGFVVAFAFPGFSDLFRVGLFFCVCFVGLFAVAWDFSSLKGGGGLPASSGARSFGFGGIVGDVRAEVFFAVVTLLIWVRFFVGDLSAFPWGHFSGSEYLFFSGCGDVDGVGRFLGFVVSDAALPSLPYRLIVGALSFVSGGTFFVRLISIVFAFGVLVLSYFGARLHKRVELAWVAPVFLFFLPSFYLLFEMVRGEAFFVFFSFASVVAFDFLLVRPSRFRLQAWLVCSIVAVMSNPVAVAVIAGPFIYYVAAYRKRCLDESFRMLLDMNFKFIISACVLMIAFTISGINDLAADGAGQGGSVETGRFFLYSIPFLAVPGALLIKNRRGIYFVSSALGAAAVLMLVKFGVFTPEPRHFLPMFPLMIICAVILDELFLEKIGIHRGHGFNKAFTGLFIITALLAVNTGQRPFPVKHFAETELQLDLYDSNPYNNPENNPALPDLKNAGDSK